MSGCCMLHIICDKIIIFCHLIKQIVSCPSNIFEGHHVHVQGWQYWIIQDEKNVQHFNNLVAEECPIYPIFICFAFVLNAGVAELRLSEVRLGQLPKWLSTCNFTPAGIVRALGRGQQKSLTCTCTLLTYIVLVVLSKKIRIFVPCSLWKELSVFKYSPLCLSRICWDWRNSFDLEKIRLMRS